MKRYIFVAVTLFFITNSLSAQTESTEFSPMTQEELEKIVLAKADSAEGSNGMIRFVYNEIPMALLSDTIYDRMRIIAPIIRQQDMTDEEIFSVLDANFHTALDARYATTEGVLYAVFIHPMSPLTISQVESALRQVSALVLNFGDTYSSGELIYGTDQSQEFDEQ